MEIYIIQIALVLIFITKLLFIKDTISIQRCFYQYHPFINNFFMMNFPIKFAEEINGLVSK